MTLVNYEKAPEEGGRTADAEVIRKLATDYGCSVAFLYEETDDPTPFNLLREADIDDPERFKELPRSTVERVLGIPGRADISDKEVDALGLTSEEIEAKLKRARKLARTLELIEELEDLKRKKSKE